MGGFLRGAAIRLGIAAGFVVVLTAAGAAHDPHGGDHASRLAGVRVDALADGRVIVSAVAGGDLAGVLTLSLTPAPDGHYGGSWAFTAAHADNTDQATGTEPPPEPHGDDHPAGHDHGAGEPGDEAHGHTDFVRLVHRGALGGSVGLATLARDGQGQITALSAPLTVGIGTQEFHGASGAGHATLTELTLGF